MSHVSLRAASLVFFGSWLVHTGDHMRRGLSILEDGVVWAGTAAAMLAAVVWTLVFSQNERAPVAAAVVGPSIAFGVAASHLLPEWGVMSDSLIDGDVDWFTWAAVLGEIAAGVFLGLVGLRILRAHHYSLAIPAPSW